jgi:hypothetical protein
VVPDLLPAQIFATLKAESEHARPSSPPRATARAGQSSARRRPTLRPILPHSRCRMTRSRPSPRWRATHLTCRLRIIIVRSSARNVSLAPST